jgi:endonuclease YncB( thermonuclease family)
MLGWGKKSEGSDNRATFAQRRDQIRQGVVHGVLGAGRAAGAGIQAVGSATLAGLRATGAAARGGARAARTAATAAVQRLPKGSSALAGMKAGVRGAGTAVRRGAQAGRSAAVTLAASARQKAGVAAGSLAEALTRPIVPGVLAAAGTLALGAGIGRYRGAGLDGEVVALLGIGAALLATLVPVALQQMTRTFPAFTWPLVAVGVGVVVVSALWPAYRDSVPGWGGSKELVGRATVVAGDVLKVDSNTVRLSGIEAPERTQLCGKDAGKWRCAEAAQTALAKVVSGRPVRCRLSGTDKAGRPLAHCSIDSVDINAELVRQGYVFAEGGSRYGRQEAEARDAKAGMWIAAALRPAEVRAKAWEEAKRQAPDGCPIKGQVKGPERVYVLPGAPAYDRLRVQTARGDRWFCSEQDATAAGFKAAQQGMPGA